jgi:hypothetical protein
MKNLNPPDQILLDMQTKWHQLKRAWVDAGCPSTGQTRRAFDHHDRKLSDYLWEKAKKDREEDRRLHPKAKRNQPVEPGAKGEGRYLP